MNHIHTKINVAFSNAMPRAELFTLPREEWHELFDSYTLAVKQSYISHGFYRIGTRKKRGPLYRSKSEFLYGVNAYMFKGIPVVVAEDYKELMRGHKSSRLVLAV